MTISNTASHATYTGNGSQQIFDVKNGSEGIYFDAASELYVTVRVDDTVTVKSIGTHYTVAGAGTDTGTITFLTAPASGAEVRIERRTPLTQTLNLTSGGAFNPTNVESNFDKVIRALQDQARGVSGGQANGTYDGDPLTKTASGTAWDGEDLPAQGFADGVNDDDLATVGQIQPFVDDAEAAAAAAATSQSAAATSATAASTSATNAATSASSASTSASAALTSATAAASSATAAASSATSASSSASAASTSATNASSSASAASTSASNAATSATEAAAAVGFVFTYSTTTTMADPGSGTVRFNNATLASVTAIAIDDLSADNGNPDVSAWILTFDNSSATNKGTLRFRKKSAPQNFVDFTVTGLTDNSGWTELAVTHAASSGSLSNADTLLMAFYATGDVGPAGPAGSGSGDVNGPASSVASEIALFDGTTGKLIKRATTTGIIKATSGVIAAAVSGTDYAPATSGSAILKGNGAGGFSSAVASTDYAPATSGSSILKGNGSGGFSNAASGTDYAPATSGTAILKGNGSGGFSAASGGTDYANASHTHTQSDLTGLTTADSPQFTGVNVGHASDTTVTRASAGVIAVEGNHVPSPASQAQGDVLYHNGTTWARLAAGTSGQFLKTNGAGANPAWADGGSTVGTPVTSGTIGYGTGTGGAVTQATSITTGVTLNKAAGAITLYSSSTLTADTVTSFTLTNSTIAATDVVLVTWKTNVTHRVSIYVSAIVGGSCKINMVNHDIATNLIVSNYVLNFVVIKAATS